MDRKDKIAVLIPCYNESKTIKKSLKILSENCHRRQSMFMTITLRMTQIR